MKLSELKNFLSLQESVNFKLPNGENVPAHFHLTEVGLVTKNFIDCGGTIREEKKISMQLWTAEDFHHRLTSEKAIRILNSSAALLGDEDLEVEVEYQLQTVSKFNLRFDQGTFQLVGTKTACLAEELCGIPAMETTKTKVLLSELSSNEQSSCVPGGGCC